MGFSSPVLASIETTLDLFFRTQVPLRNRPRRKIHYFTVGREVWIRERILYPPDGTLWFFRKMAKLQFVPDRNRWILNILAESGDWIKVADAPEVKLPVLLEASMRWYFR